MHQSPPAQLRVVNPGPENQLALGPATFWTGKAAWTDGAYCVSDHVIAPHVITPPHVHAVESQVTIVLSGRFGFWVDGTEMEAGPGTYVMRPAGLPHALWNPTDEPARMIEITSPATAFEEYMHTLSELMSSGTAEPAAVIALGEKYQISFLPDVLEELCERHGVDPGGVLWK